MDRDVLAVGSKLGLEGIQRSSAVELLITVFILPGVISLQIRLQKCTSAHFAVSTSTIHYLHPMIATHHP